MARRGSGGLQSNPLADVLADDEEREEAAAVAAAEAAGAVVRDLPVKAVAPDPENPLSRLQPDQELVNSIKAEGQLQAGVVVPLDVWVGYGNDPMTLYTARAEAEGVDIEPADDDADAVKALAKAIEKAKAEIEYVISFGHRRWAGCVEAGKDTYKAVVTDTIKDNTTKRVHRLIENYMRKNVTPLEEADEFYRLTTEDKLGQREISRRTGIPQPYISKRLGLRALPEAAKQAIADKVITVEVANELAKMTDDKKRIGDVITQIVSYSVDASTEEEKARKIEARNRFAVDLVRRERNSYDAAKERAKLRKKLASEGVTVIDDLNEYFREKPHPRWKYQIHGDDKVQAAREAGSALAYVYSRDQVEWYTTEEPREPEETDKADDGDQAAEATSDVIPAPRSGATPTAAPAPVRETEEQRQHREEREREERERKAADEARAAACLRIASKAPNRDQLTARLARRVLMFEETYDYDAQQLAAEWLKAAAVVDADLPTHAVFGQADGLDPKTVARVAYVYDLAMDEARVRESDELDSQDSDHIERLMKEAGYTPSPWEQKRLDELTTTAS
jgi:ParB/RepB/Spo0J family partition protein